MPWLAREGGYPGATTALIGISVPLAASFLGLRGWSLARLIGARGPGELLAKFYGNGVAVASGLLVAFSALVLLALVLVASASLIEALSTGIVSQTVALHLAALFLLLSGAPAGIRAAGRLARFHATLVLIGVGAALVLTIVAVGGIDATLDALAHVGRSMRWGTTEGRGGGDYDLALAVAGAFGAGTIWSGTTILSIQVALGGTILMLVWLPHTMAAQDPRRFTRQLSVGAAYGGAALIAVTFVLGLATLDIDKIHFGAPLVPFADDARLGESIARIIDTIADERLWSASALLGLGAGAALHALALSLMAAIVAALRPLWTRRRTGAGSAERNLAVSQGLAAALVVIALLLAYLPARDLAMLSALALALAPLTALPLAAACWFPDLSRGGLTAGLVAGTVAALTAATQTETAVHAASIGGTAAIIVAAIASRLRRADGQRTSRRDSHRSLDRIFAGPDEQRSPDGGFRWMAALGVLVWVFFAIGPGLVIGNDLFGAPNQPRARWDFSIPSIAIWQILAWATGVGLVGFIARRVGIAMITRDQMIQITAQMDPQSADRSGNPDQSGSPETQ